MGDMTADRLVSDEEIEQARRAGQVFIRVMRRVAKTLTPRDRVYLGLGLRASHLEEALVQGDIERAHAHYVRILEIARMLTS